MDVLGKLRAFLSDHIATADKLAEFVDEFAKFTDDVVKRLSQIEAALGITASGEPLPGSNVTPITPTQTETETTETTNTGTTDTGTTETTDTETNAGTGEVQTGGPGDGAA